MARLWTSGGESQHFFSEGCTTASSASPYVTFDTTNKRIAATRASYKFNSTATPAVAIAHYSYATTNGRYYYFRGYIRLSSADGQANIPIFAQRNSGGTSQLEVRLNASNQLQLYNANSAANIGSPSFTLAASQWYKMEVGIMVFGSGTLNCFAELRINGNVIATSAVQTFSTTALGGLRFGWPTTAPTASEQIWFDDIALNDNQGANQNTWCGDGQVYLLLPTADNARGANWYNDNAATTNMYAALDNTPPIGLAHSTANAANVQDYNVTASLTDPASKLDLTMQTYTAAGISASEVIKVIVANVSTATNAATARAHNAYILSNPAETAPSTFNTPASIAGTYPTNWAHTFRTVLYNSTPTRGTAPVLTIHKEVANAAAILACFAGITVETQYATGTRRGMGRMRVAATNIERAVGRMVVGIQRTRRGMARMSVTGVTTYTAFRRGMARLRIASTGFRRGSGRASVQYHQDTFDRANAAVIGTASDGHTYQNVGGQGGVSITNNTYQNKNVNALVSHIHGTTAYGDCSQQMDFLITGDWNIINFNYRTQANNSVSDGYRVRISNNLNGGYVVGSTYTVINNTVFVFVPGTWYSFKSQIVGYTMKSKVWERGTAEPDWMLETIDTNQYFTSGYIGFGSNAGATTGRQINIDNYVVGDVEGRTNTMVRRGAARMLLTLQGVLRGSARMVLGLQQKRRGSGRIRLGLRSIRRGVARAVLGIRTIRRGSGRAKVVGRVSRRGTARVKLWIQTRRRGTARLRVGLRHITRGMARVRVGLQIIRRGSARIRVGLQRRYRGMARLVVRGQISRRGAARAKITIRIIRRGTARLFVRGQTTQRGAARVRVGLLVIRRGMARISVEAGISSAYRRATARMRIQAKRMYRSSARMRVGLRRTYRGMARAKIVGRVSRRGSARIKLWIQSTRRGSGRAKVWVQRKLRGSARLRIGLLHKWRGSARVKIVASTLRRGVARMTITLVTPTIQRKATGRIKTVRLSLQRATARMRLGLRKQLRGMVRARVVIQVRKYGKARASVSVQLHKRATARARIALQNRKRGTARIWMALQVRRRGVARAKIAIQKQKRGEARAKVSIRTQLRGMAYMRVLLLHATYLRARGRMVVHGAGIKRGQARMVVTEFTGYIVSWEQPEAVVVWETQSTTVTWDMPETDVAWKEPIVAPEWELPDTGVTWKERIPR